MHEDLRARIVALLPQLRRFARGLTGGVDDAEDLLQSACLKALSRLDQFEEGTRLDSWMYRIVQTTWIDRARAERVRAPASPDALETLCDGGIGARTAEARLDLARLRRDVARLPEDQRAVLLLVAVEGRAYREAAEILDVPIGTVMSRLARARRKLLEARRDVEERHGKDA